VLDVEYLNIFMGNVLVFSALIENQYLFYEKIVSTLPTPYFMLPAELLALPHERT
jgi:hypothetical protein